MINILFSVDRFIMRVVVISPSYILIGCIVNYDLSGIVKGLLKGIEVTHSFPLVVI